MVELGLEKLCSCRTLTFAPALLSSCDGFTSFRPFSIFCSVPHKSRALSYSSPCDLALSFSSETLQSSSPVGCIQLFCWREFRICPSFGPKVCTLHVTLHEVTRGVSLWQDRAVGLHRPTLPRHYSSGPQGFLIGDGAWGPLEVTVA